MRNYCTLWPEGWWGDCCKQHDLDYLNQVSRELADTKLFQCVVESSPSLISDQSLIISTTSLIIASLMYIGVRLFGGYFYKK